jgi:hypothetical protein
VGREGGHALQIQRAFPTHYFSSWIDLPQTSAHLRGVPELLVTALCNDAFNKELAIGPGIVSRQGSDQIEIVRTSLLSPFFNGYFQEGSDKSNLSSDGFSDDALVGLHELLTIRIAQQCGRAPEKLAAAGLARVENLQPISSWATDAIQQDLLTLLKHFGGLKQKRQLQRLLEAGICLCVTTVLTSTLSALEQWEIKGEITEPKDGFVSSLFIDATNGTNIPIRNVSEKIALQFRSRFVSMSSTFMKLRILDYLSSTNRHTKEHRPEMHPNPTKFLNFLGALYAGTHPKSDKIQDEIFRVAQTIVDAVDDGLDNTTFFESDIAELRQALKIDGSPDQLLTALSNFIHRQMGSGQTTTNFGGLWRSTLYVNSPLGLGSARDTWPSVRGRRSKKEAISIVLSNVMLDYLVHIHTAPEEIGGKPRSLSYPHFLELLRTRYGLYIDQAPEGENISGEILELNRRSLEARLRDLGLLVGVNDAESMKRLRPRFQPAPIAEFYAGTEAAT